jgi:hypothetical protein
LFTLRDKDGHRSIRDRSLPAIHQLNQLWKHHQPASIHIRGSGDQRVKLEVNGTVVLETLQGDAQGENPMTVATRWASALKVAFESSEASASQSGRY